MRKNKFYIFDIPGKTILVEFRVKKQYYIIKWRNVERTGTRSGSLLM